MTQFDLQRGNELVEKIKEITDNLLCLNNALNYEVNETTAEKIKKFFFSCFDKNKIRIVGGCVSFGGHLVVDRECMEILQDYFKKKLAEAQAEFESIGKGGEG